MRSEERWVLQESKLKRLDRYNREVLGVSWCHEVNNINRVSYGVKQGSDLHTDTAPVA